MFRGKKVAIRYFNNGVTMIPKRRFFQWSLLVYVQPNLNDKCTILFSQYLLTNDALCLSTARDCLDLRPPENGAKACDDWFVGRMCSPSCNDRWEFTQAIPPYTIWSCGASGIWLPPMRWPDCTSKYYFLRKIDSDTCHKIPNWHYTRHTK